MPDQTPAPARPWLPWALLLAVLVVLTVGSLLTGHLVTAAATALCGLPVALRLAGAVTGI